MKTLAYSPIAGHGSTIFKSIFDYSFDALQNEGLVDKKTQKQADALILWGGTDIHPSLYKQKANNFNQVKGHETPSQRDVLEWHLIGEAVRANIPIIGICRGAQMLCAFANGSLYQDVSGHQGDHTIDTYDGNIFTTTSAHHQMMDITNTDCDVLAWSSRNLSMYYHKEKSVTDIKPSLEPEVVIFKGIKGFAIQGHPEWQESAQKYQPFNEWLIKEFKELMV